MTLTFRFVVVSQQSFQGAPQSAPAILPFKWNFPIFSNPLLPSAYLIALEGTQERVDLPSQINTLHVTKFIFIVILLDIRYEACLGS